MPAPAEVSDLKPTLGHEHHAAPAADICNRAMIADEKRLVFDCLVDKGKSRLRAWAKFGDCFRVEGTKSCRLPAPARIGVQMYSQGIMCKMIAQCPKVSVAMNTVEVALAVILWQIFPLRRNIVSMLPALWPMDRKTWT